MQMLDPHQHNKSHDNRNVFAAVALAAIAIIGFEYLWNLKEPVVTENNQAVVMEKSVAATSNTDGLPSTPEDLNIQGGKIASSVVPADASDAIKRISIDSDLFTGSISLKGGRVDALSIPHFKTELHGTEPITIFRASGKDAHFFDAGWLSTSGVSTPNGNTVWRAQGSSLALGKPLTLVWSNGTGQQFQRTFTIEESSYTINVVDTVTNTADTNLNLTHYAQIHKTGVDLEGGGSLYNAEQSTFYNFLGPMGFVDGIRVEADYEDLQEVPVKEKGAQGWIGITSRYFMAALVPDQLTDQTFLWKHSKVNGRDFYTTIMQPEPLVASKGQTISYEYTLYAGPKASTELSKAGAHLNKAVDYGWFDVIARPIYIMVMWFHGIFGNFGLAIIGATIVLKIITYPLSYKSYSAMAKMRKLQPRLTQLKERYADNKEQFAMEMMSLYREHRVNPLSGCWPTLIQIPIFFAFYKVILISFEFRHAPLALWIEDMSVKDPYFVLPVLMGLSMMLQMRLSPTSADPNQQMMMKIMPVVFTFMFLWFPSGLVLYWLTNNVVSILQQLYVMRKVS
jgi:YidC/Oxa1 family membrane protein insertase